MAVGQNSKVQRGCGSESKTGKEQESGIDQNLFNRKEKGVGGGRGAGKENAA